MRFVMVETLVVVVVKLYWATLLNIKDHKGARAPTTHKMHHTLL